MSLPVSNRPSYPDKNHIKVCKPFSSKFTPKNVNSTAQNPAIERIAALFPRQPAVSLT